MSILLELAARVSAITMEASSRHEDSDPCVQAEIEEAINHLLAAKSILTRASFTDEGFRKDGAA